MEPLPNGATFPDCCHPALSVTPGAGVANADPAQASNLPSEFALLRLRRDTGGCKRGVPAGKGRVALISGRDHSPPLNVDV